MTTTDNEKLIKAQIESMVLADAGKLNDAQATKFLEWVVDESRLKEFARPIMFKNPNFDLTELKLGRRVAMTAEEAKDPLVRRGVTTEKRQLRAHDFVVPFEITDKFAELNLQGVSVKDTIINMMAKTAANNMEEAMLIGNAVANPAILESEYKSGGSATQYVKDNFLSLDTGWIEHAYEGHVVDAGGETIGLGIFGKMQRALPHKYRRDMRNMRMLLSPDLWSLYQERIGGRATALGDAVAGGADHKPFGMTPFAVPLFALNSQTTEHKTLTGLGVHALRSSNISSVVVLPTTLGAAPTTPYIENTDYTIDYGAGTISRLGGGAIGDGASVKVQYLAAPQIIFTHKDNLVIGMSREISIERDRQIYGRVDEFAIHMSFGVQIQNADAIVVVKNIGTGV
jgi:hypothetical protein